MGTEEIGGDEMVRQSVQGDIIILINIDKYFEIGTKRIDKNKTQH